MADRVGPQQAGRRHRSPLNIVISQNEQKMLDIPLGFSIAQRDDALVATQRPQEPAMTTRTLKTLIQSTMFRFTTLASAKAFQARANDIMMIVLGDHDGERGEFWVVTPADAARLTRAGYEMV